MAQAKRIYILTIKVNKLFFFFVVVVFLKRKRKYVLHVSIELYNHVEALVKVWKNSKSCGITHLAAYVPTAFLVLSNFHSCFCSTIRLQMFELKI